MLMPRACSMACTGRLPLPSPGTYSVVYVDPSGECWATLPLSREFLLQAAVPGPAIVELLDSKIDQVRAEHI